MEHETFMAFTEVIERQKMLEQYLLRVLKNQGDPMVQEVKPAQQPNQGPTAEEYDAMANATTQKIVDEGLDDDDEPTMQPQPIIAKKKKSWEDEVDDEEQAAEFEMMNQKAMEKKQQSKQSEKKAYDTVD